MRKKWIKRIGIVMAAVVVCMGYPASVCMAQETGDSNQQAQQVFDEAKLLDQDQVRALTEEVNGLEQQTGWDAMVLTVDDAQGQTAQSCGEYFFSDHATKEDGVVCVLDMDNREIALVTSGEAIRYLTDDRIADTLDYSYQFASDGDYGDTLSTMVMYVSYYYGKGIPDDQANYNTDTGEYDRYQKPKQITAVEVVVAAILGGAALGVTVLLINGKYRLKFGVTEDGFYQHSRLNLTGQKEQLINRYVTTRKIPKNPPPSGGGGGSISSTHIGGGGGTFGGGSHKF